MPYEERCLEGVFLHCPVFSIQSKYILKLICNRVKISEKIFINTLNLIFNYYIIYSRYNEETISTI